MSTQPDHRLGPGRPLQLLVNPEKAEGLSPELQSALQPLLAGLESLSEQIREYNAQIEKLAQESYPQVALLKQIKGVGTLIALTFC